MLPICHHARTLRPLRWGCSRALGQTRHYAAKAVKPVKVKRIDALSSDYLKALDPIAKRLSDTTIWHKRPPKHRNTGDPFRVNVTNEDLIDDVINYIKPSLMRHEGCDLIDLFPGAGVWSRKLHDLLRPRSHLLMEPDLFAYEPFLRDLTEKPGVILEPRSGILWDEISEILTPKYLPHQVERPRTYGPDSEPPQRNDTLLVTINMSQWPERKLFNFKSITILVIYQLVTAIRTAALWNKYGLVRVLMWTRPDDIRTIFPRSVGTRRQGPVTAEFNTEWIREVAGPDFMPTVHKGRGDNSNRDTTIDLQSAFDVALNMREQGIVTPRGRESQLLRQAQAMLDGGAESFPLQPRAGRVWKTHITEELQQLQKQFDEGKILKGTAEYDKLKRKLYYHNWNATRGEQVTDMTNKLDHIKQLYLDGKSKQAAKMQAEWVAAFDGMNKQLQMEFSLHRDNWHVFRQEPRPLHWDRRPYEPLLVQPTDFFPNVPCSLLDIQPKAPHWLVRDIGKDSLYRAGEYFELILRHAAMENSGRISKVFSSLEPGVMDGVIGECKSLRDVRQFGSPVPGGGELTVRSLNEAQWMEIMQKWIEWPFRPEFRDFVSAHIADESGSEDTEDSAWGNARGSGEW